MRVKKKMVKKETQKKLYLLCLFLWFSGGGDGVLGVKRAKTERREKERDEKDKRKFSQLPQAFFNYLLCLAFTALPV